MPHQHHIWPPLCAAAVLALTSVNLAQSAPLMIVGNDEKLLFDDNGKPLLSLPGKDSVVILDLADPENPKTVANLPLKNSVVGPPVNVAIDLCAKTKAPFRYSNICSLVRTASGPLSVLPISTGGF